MMTLSPHHEFSSTNCLNMLLEYDPRQQTASQSSIVSLDHHFSFFPSIATTQVMNNNNNNNSNNNKTAVKKLNHNASERDRRKKINTLYSNLRSLLPPEDQSKKLSIPATVTRVLKYIPELQKEVRRLNQKKESFITKSSMKENHHPATLGDFKNNIQIRKRKTYYDRSNSQLAVSAIQINDREIAVQSSMTKTSNGFFSKAIAGLEKEGFVVQSASCFQSFDGRVFNNLLLQAQLGCRAMDAEKLKEEIIAFYEKPYYEHYC